MIKTILNIMTTKNSRICLFRQYLLTTENIIKYSNTSGIKYLNIKIKNVYVYIIVIIYTIQQNNFYF